jgi:hypothetical protein
MPIEEEQEIILEQSVDCEKMYRIMLNINHMGTQLIHRLFVSILIPQALLTSRETEKHISYYPGSRENWYTNVNVEQVNVVFKSNNDYILYPQENVHFFTLRIPVLPKISYPHRSAILYSYAHEFQTSTNNQLFIRVEPEDFSRSKYNVDPTMLS